MLFDPLLSDSMTRSKITAISSNVSSFIFDSKDHCDEGHHVTSLPLRVVVDESLIDMFEIVLAIAKLEPKFT